jgi:hypothetical protein
MARQVVGNPFENQIGTVSATATPVDIYQRGVVKRSPFATLADTLSNLEQKASPILERERQRAAEREYQEGIRLHQENRVAIGEAVKQGLIDEGESPYLRKGYRVSQMNTLSAQYATELENALATQKLYTNGNPAAIDNFTKSFQEEFIKKNGMSEFADHEMAEYFGSSAIKHEESFRAAWRSKNIAWQKEQNYKAKEAEVAQMVSTLLQDDLSEEDQDIATTKLVQWIQVQSENGRLDGQDNARVNSSIVNGVIFAATQLGDPEVLDVLMRTKVGTGFIGKSVDNLKTIAAARSTIARNNETLGKAADTRIDAAHEALRGKISAEIFNNVHGEGYNKDFVDARINQLIATGVEKNVDEAISLMDYVNKVNNLVNKQLLEVSPTTLNTLSLQLERVASPSEARSIIVDFATQNGQDEAFVRRYMQDWNTYYNPKGEETFGLNFNTSSTEEGKLLAQLDQQIFGNEDSENYTKPEYVDTSMRVRRLAKYKIREAVKKWFSENEGQGEVPPPIMEQIVYEVFQGIQKSYFDQDGTGTSKVPALVEATSKFGYDVGQFGGGR